MGDRTRFSWFVTNAKCRVWDGTGRESSKHSIYESARERKELVEVDERKTTAINNKISDSDDKTWKLYSLYCSLLQQVHHFQIVFDWHFLI